MRKRLFLALTLLGALTGAHAEVDPNFYIYLCFGQSNMEGNATPETVDKANIDPRFKTLACVNFQSPARTMGQWYTAVPPLVRQGTGLGMADYFGRTMVANLPQEVKVGVVDVAIGGTKIEGFMQDKVAAYIASMTANEQWLKNYFAAYDNDPYKRLVDMAKIAQQSGVIKGILLHQGESNNMQQDWPQKVKTIYDRLLSDLGLQASETPLFVGEMLSQAAGGACYGHNSIIRSMPSVIANSHVISSAGCPGKDDHLHFLASGYRTMGRRYAIEALRLMGIDAEEGEESSQSLKIDKRMTSIAEAMSQPVAIVNETEKSAIYGIKDQNLGYDNYEAAFNEANTGYLFRIQKVTGGYLLRLITPGGDEYSIWGSPGYLNGFSTVADCSFILGLNNRNGQDVKNGALWDIQYVDDKGFSLKNIYTGKYLRDALSAKYEQPTYFSFCTLSYQTTGISEAKSEERSVNSQATYDLSGRRVDSRHLRSGIYIRSGKKVFLR